MLPPDIKGLMSEILSKDLIRDDKNSKNLYLLPEMFTYFFRITLFKNHKNQVFSFFLVKYFLFLSIIYRFSWNCQKIVFNALIDMRKLYSLVETSS